MTDKAENVIWAWVERDDGAHHWRETRPYAWEPTRYIRADLYDAQAAEIAALKAEIAELKRKMDFFSDLPTLKRENERQAAEIEALKTELDRTRHPRSWHVRRRSNNNE